ncbi:histidine kinase [Micromonospora sp. KC207]|uniref:sensor histidine kinase n=1 Tax=Micromonospora sp. KC207 TaxID=2530377 RepID=UPI001044E1C3|nr:histidine kinase [Micromonospora sp. KC207]TDC59244.1 histidine kinase [Micromonospora sp. KC207]
MSMPTDPRRRLLGGRGGTGPIIAEAGGAASLALLTGMIWAVTGGGYFWPRWAWFGLAVAVGTHLAVRRALQVPRGRRRWLALHAALACVLASAELAVWALSGGGYFWPIWALMLLASGVGTHAWVVSQLPPERERELTRRIDALARTRRGAVDAQVTELKRIERDLHDGAQARMVSVGMTLGLAEHLLRTDPAAGAQLVSEARATTLSALDDLRAVMRAIHPAVLADRGLDKAVEALALDLAVPTSVSCDLPGPAPAAIESALYFSIAECLTNVVKHSHATTAAVDISFLDGRLVAVVVDDGVGGASIDGGTGLHGIARRLEAFDGIIWVNSPAGGPTSITLEVPCELSSRKTSLSSGTA